MTARAITPTSACHHISQIDLKGGGWKHTVDVHLGVTNNLLDLSLLLKVSKALAGQAAVDLETVDQSGDSDQTVGLDILVETLSDLLLEDDGVLGLVLDYNRRKKAMSVISVLFHLLGFRDRSHSFILCVVCVISIHSYRGIYISFLLLFDRYNNRRSSTLQLDGGEWMIFMVMVMRMETGNYSVPLPLDHFFLVGACV